MADSTTAQTPRSHLQCANPVCKFLVHELEEFGGYCCRRCHEHHHKQSTTKSPKHGKLCQQRQAPDGVVRSTPDVPSRPLMELTPQAAARRSHSPRRTRSRGTANQRRREGMPQTHSHRREGRPQTHSHQSVATSGEWSPASTLPYGPHGTPPSTLVIDETERLQWATIAGKWSPAWSPATTLEYGPHGTPPSGSRLLGLEVGGGQG